MCDADCNVPAVRLNARARVILAALGLTAVILSTRAALPLAVCAVSLAAALSLGIPARVLRGRLAAPLGMAAVLVVLQGFLVGTTSVASWQCGPWTLSLRLEGLGQGALLGARVLGAVSVVLLLALTTPVHQILYVLRVLRVPEAWVEIAAVTVRYISTLREDAAGVASAQRVRLGYVGARRSLASAGALCGEVLIRSVDQAARTHEAMRTRGYNGSMPWAPLPELRAGDRITVFLAAALLAAVLWVVEVGAP